MWQIKCYVSPGGKNEIQNTYDSGNDDLKVELEVELEYLSVRDRELWLRPHAAKLSKCSEFRDFFEIRLFANQVQQRPIGFFGPGQNEFTILLWAIEKGGELKPQEWCKKANRRRLQLIDGETIAKPLELEGNEDA